MPQIDIVSFCAIILNVSIFYIFSYLYLGVYYFLNFFNHYKVILYRIKANYLSAQLFNKSTIFFDKKFILKLVVYIF